MKALDLEHVNQLSKIDAALYYASLGWRVFPLTPGDKTPLLGVRWKDSATTDEVEIRRWWSAVPDANIGWALSRNWFGLDMDQRDDRDGWASYLAAGGPESPPWPMQLTPSGGRHLLMRGVPGKNFTRRGQFGGLDGRAEGGYLAVAPSVTLEGVYEWRNGAPLARVPPSLLEAILSWQPKDRGEPIELPPSRVVTPEEVRDRCLALGPSHAAYLLEGRGVTGDDSRDAYRACCAAFAAGWTLEDMASIGPHTALMELASRHGASRADPWTWVSKYTIGTAWEDTRAEKSPEVLAGLEVKERREALRNETDDTPTLEQLQVRAELLTREDLMEWLEDVARADFGEWDEDLVTELLKSAKKATGISLTALRERLIEVQGGLASPEQSGDVYVSDQNLVMLTGPEVLVSVTAYMMDKARGHRGNESKAKRVWLTGTNSVCEQVHSLTYHPGLPHGVAQDGPKKVYNQYRPPAAGEGDPDAADVWLDLLEWLDFEVEPGVLDYLLDTWAFWVQNPGYKANYGVLIGGAPGIGKDSLIMPVKHAVGMHNVKTVEGGSLGSDFNDYLERCKLLIVNEMAWGNHADQGRIAELLKPVLAAPPHTLVVNQKHMKRYEIPNLVQTILMTNSYHCGHFDPGERRYLCMWAQADVQGRKGFPYGDYYRWLEKGGYGHVAAFLRARDLSKYSPAEPPVVTPWLEDLMTINMDHLGAWLQGAIAERAGVFARDRVSTLDILTYARETRVSEMLGRLSAPRIERVMRLLGFKPLRPRGNHKRLDAKEMATRWDVGAKPGPMLHLVQGGVDVEEGEEWI